MRDHNSFKSIVRVELDGVLGVKLDKLWGDIKKFESGKTWLLGDPIRIQLRGY